MPLLTFVLTSITQIDIAFVWFIQIPGRIVFERILRQVISGKSCIVSMVDMFRGVDSRWIAIGRARAFVLDGN